jgi:hypothetical protein
LTGESSNIVLSCSPASAEAPVGRSALISLFVENRAGRTLRMKGEVDAGRAMSDLFALVAKERMRQPYASWPRRKRHH